MKKLLTYLLLVLMFGAVFGIALHDVRSDIQKETPVVSTVLECITPAIAYADSDTAYGPGTKPPPPPID